MIQPKPEQIIAWVEKNFDPVKKKKGKNGIELAVNNPLGDDGRCHLWINVEMAVCNDWRPDHKFGGKKGGISLLGLVQKMRNVSFAAAVREVCGVEVNLRYLLKEKLKAEQEKKQLKAKLPDGAIPIKETKAYRNIAINYLAGRKISEEKAQQYKLYYTVGSIIFPYFEFEELVYWQSRDIHNKRFHFPPDFDVSKGDVLFGLDLAEHGLPVYITEAILCSMSIGEGGLAVGGSTISDQQISKLSILAPSCIVLCPDNDPSGIASLKSMFFAIRKRLPGMDIQYSIPPKEENVKDWNNIEQKYGIGSARKYVLSNSAPLNLTKIVKMMPRERTSFLDQK